METLIKTNKSFLNLYNSELVDEMNLEISECVKEIKNKLKKNPEIKIFNKTCYQHRSIGFFSDDSIGYKYSGQLAKSQKLTPKLKKLINIINEKFKSDFNGILINKYENGEDYIGKHSDDENSLGSCGVISISYGATRKFRLRDKANNKKVDLYLKNNEMIHMGGNFQKEFTHEIPIEKKVKEERYSFTLRKHLV